MKSKYYIILLSLLVSSCFTSRKLTQLTDDTEIPGVDSLCLNMEPYQSLYMNKIKARVIMDGEIYDAKVSLYYLPDSVIFISAANTGFEIVRVAITADSTVFINRIDKLVYIYRESKLGYRPPVEFENLEYLLNKKLACEEIRSINGTAQREIIDFSVQDITRKITYDLNTLKINKFEFFHTKTNEYIVGEITSSDSLSVFSNYIFENVEIMAAGGEITYNKEIFVDLSFNKNKYTILEY